MTLTSSASTLPTELEGARASELSDKVDYLRDANRRKVEIIMQQAMTNAATHSGGATGAARSLPDTRAVAGEDKERAPGSATGEAQEGAGAPSGPGDDASSEGSPGHHSCS